ncbi:MAG: EAL domain-containing protein [Candidatus Nanopelagicales bacterium]
MSGRVRDHMRRASVATLTVDPAGRLTFMTPRAAALVGLDPADVGSPAVGILGGALATPYAELHEPDTETVRRITTRAGGELDLVVARTDDGGTAWFLATALDLSEPDPAAYESWALLDTIMSSTRDAVLVTTAEPFDLPGPLIVWGNRALEEHTGYRLEELVGRSPRIFQGPGTDMSATHEVSEALRRWEPAKTEVLNYRKDGTPFWVEFDVVPVADADGWFTHWVSVQRDTTERRAEQQRVEEQRRLVQTILDSLPAQTAMIDRDGWILAVNRPWHEVWHDGSDDVEPDWSRVNYLEVCRASSEPRLDSHEDPGGPEAYVGILRVLAGEQARFGMDYCCEVRGELRWFHLQVAPLSGRDGAVITHTDITARKDAESELTHQATHDALTGLPNRELLLGRLAETLALGRERRELTAVAFVDLDNFKDVNDAFGHGYGDRVLDVVGERLQTAVRREDLVARVGGDEYVIVLGGLPDGWDAEDYFTRLRDVVSRPIELGVASIRPSMSVGIVTSPPHHGDAEAVLRDADTAMYASKRGGRDRWTMFSRAVRETALTRALTEDRLATALHDDMFQLHFQPIVDLRQGITVGSEALLRLRTPDGDLLYPDQFLAAVENGPLAADVGLWVLDHAVAQQARWMSVSPRHTMSVNISPRQLGHGRLPEEVREVLARHGVPPEQLVLEVTEDLLVEASGRATEELADIRALGVRLAVDDFGTGFSALSYLATMPVDVLKIDRSFVVGSGTERGEALLAAVGGMAAVVDAISVCEGIETVEELERVRRLGYTLGQGFLFARPRVAGAGPTDPSAASLDAFDAPEMSD